MKSDEDVGQANSNDADDSQATSSDCEDDLDAVHDITSSSANGKFSHGITFPSLHDNPTVLERMWYDAVRKDWGDYMMFLDEPEAHLLGKYVHKYIKQGKDNQQRLGKQVRLGNWVAWLLVRSMWPRSKIKASKLYSIFKTYWDEDQDDKLFWIPYPTEWPVALPEQAEIRLRTIKQLQAWHGKLQDSGIRDELQRTRTDGNWYEKKIATDLLERLQSDDRDDKVQEYIESLAKQGLPKPEQTKNRAASPDSQASPQRKRRCMTSATPQPTPINPQVDGADGEEKQASGSPRTLSADPTSNMSEQLEALEEKMETLERETRGIRTSIENQTELFQQIRETCKATLRVTKALKTHTSIVLAEMGYELG